MLKSFCRGGVCVVATAAAGGSLVVFFGQLRPQLPNTYLNPSVVNSSEPDLGPGVAAIVAVHPPKFHLLLKFFEQWLNCAEGRAAVEFMPVFSTDQDRREFTRLWQESTNATPLVWTPLVAQHIPPEASPASWKKLEGVAQVLEMQSNASTMEQHRNGSGKQIYEFALMLDSELALHNCTEFSNLRANLRERHQSRVWYGDYGGEYNVHTMRGAGDCIIAHLEESVTWKSATNNFTTFTWWNDLPYLHLATAKDMFDTMALNSKRPNATPTQITARMGMVCGQAFEHLIYQAFTVLHRDFRCVDLTRSTIGKPSRKPFQYSFNELFWNFDSRHKLFILKVVSPMWLPWVKNSESLLANLKSTWEYRLRSWNYRPHLLWYHVDRDWANFIVNEN